MLVDVQRLRRRGEKIAPADVLATRPVRGELAMDLGYDMRRGRATAYAILVRGFDGLLPPLRDIRKVKIRKGAIYLLGGTECADSGDGRRFNDYVQSWRCVPVPTAETSQMSLETRPACSA